MRGGDQRKMRGGGESGEGYRGEEMYEEDG
jgi:hypothetical protein